VKRLPSPRLISSQFPPGTLMPTLRIGDSEKKGLQFCTVGLPFGFCFLGTFNGIDDGTDTAQRLSRQSVPDAPTAGSTGLSGDAGLRCQLELPNNALQFFGQARQM
jgi:hypothetical protein